jgi:hypothetical protein
MVINTTILEEVKLKWRTNWPLAKRTWSPFVKLQEPIWCHYTADAGTEGLQGSFAMIRLTDHRIVIDLEEVIRSGVADYSLQILAHEIGHHIYTPANLRDNAIAMGRIRWGLADIENRAAFVANIYEDMLINDKLHRTKQLDMAAVYAQINKGIQYSEVWILIMRSFEYLWKLRRSELAGNAKLHTAKIDADASLIASLIRSYSKNWIDGAGRFAALLYPYLLEEEKYQKARKFIVRLLDAESAGTKADVISGLTELDLDAILGAIDPRLETMEAGKDDSKNPQGIGKAEHGGVGPKQRYLSPGFYIDLQKQVNPNASEQQLLNNYYREIALPHLIDFPRDEVVTSSLTIPEGVDTWEISEPIEDIDWLETIISSPQLIPGFNTRKRIYGPDNEEVKSEQPLNIYIGIDCSGSMVDPRHNFSWPVLAATVIALSALRVGARVMGCLSGEPGKYLETSGFAKTEKDILTVLTSYLGTGYSFGIPRLNNPFAKPSIKKAHIVLVTDDDIFSMLSADTGKNESNWIVIERALRNAGGVGSIVLHARPDWHKEEIKKLQAIGWKIYYVTNEEELLEFATKFSKTNYQPIL